MVLLIDILSTLKYQVMNFVEKVYLFHSISLSLKTSSLAESLCMRAAKRVMKAFPLYDGVHAGTQVSLA